jgi:multidrug efflux pump subunit AcrA (membrane-fusion protein)
MPLLMWGLAVAGVVALWEGRTTRVDGQGMFDGRRAEVRTNASTRIRKLHVGLGQRVSAMEVIVELDDAEVQAERKVAESELERLEADLEAAKLVLEVEAAEREQAASERLADRLSSDRNYAMRVERLRLDKLDRMVQLATDEVEVQRLAASYERNRKLHERGVVGDEDLDLIRFEYEAMKRKVEVSKEALAIVEDELKTALQRKVEPVREAVERRNEIALAPVREAIQVQRDRVEQIKVRLREYTIRAPFDGVIAMIHSYEGQEVRAGDTVLTVIDPEPIRIVGFLQPGKPVRPYPRMQVEVRRRTTPIQIARAEVLQVGAEVELIPPQVTGNTTTPVWGTRVLIELPPSMSAGNPKGIDLGHPPPKLGEPVDIRYIVSSAAER